MRKVLFTAVCLLAIYVSQISAVVFPYSTAVNQCEEGANWSILPGVDADDMCVYGDSIAALVAGLNEVKASLPDPEVPITMQSLADYMITNEYFDRCPEGLSAAQCLLFAPVEVFLALGPSSSMQTLTTMPSMEICQAAARREKVVFLREKTQALRLVFGCDESGVVGVMNTHGRVMDIVTSESVAEIYVFDIPTKEHLALAAKLAAPVIPHNYPLYKQCDPKWKYNKMGSNGETICQVGCLMSSTSMGLRGHGIPHPNGTAMNPAVLNDWLRKNGGYTPGSAFIEGVISKVCSQRSNQTRTCSASWPSDAMHKNNDLSLSTVQSYISRGRVMIANVNGGRHFVLATGWDKNNPDTIYVNDPGAGKPSFSFKRDIVGWRIFDFKGTNFKTQTKTITELAQEWASQN